MMIKIATLVTILVLALGTGGIAVAAAQASIPDGGTAVKAETQTKNAGEGTQLMIQTMAQAMTQTTGGRDALGRKRLLYFLQLGREDRQTHAHSFYEGPTETLSPGEQNKYIQSRVDVGYPVHVVKENDPILQHTF